MPDPMGSIEFTWPFYAGFLLAYLAGFAVIGTALHSNGYPWT